MSLEVVPSYRKGWLFLHTSMEEYGKAQRKLEEKAGEIEFKEIQSDPSLKFRLVLNIVLYLYSMCIHVVQYRSGLKATVPVPVTHYLRSSGKLGRERG